MKIVKILLDDGTSKEVNNALPLSHFAEKHSEESKWYQKRMYEDQFDDLENDILELLKKYNVEEFAKNELSLVEESEIEKPDIDDFSDKEILDAVVDRGLNFGKNIVEVTFIERFVKIVNAENVMLIDNLLLELEKKLNI